MERKVAQKIHIKSPWAQTLYLGLWHPYNAEAHYLSIHTLEKSIRMMMMIGTLTEKIKWVANWW